MNSVPSVLERVTPQQMLGWTAALAHLPGTCLFFSGSDFDSAQHSILVAYPTEQVCVDANQADPWGELEQLLICDGSEKPLWVGFLGYEMGMSADPDVRLSYRKSVTPDAYFQQSALTVVLEHHSRRAKVWGVELLPKQSDVPEVGSCSLEVVEFGLPYDDYVDKVRQAQEAILDGEIYQANISQPFTFRGKVDPFTVFSQLAIRNPAPFSAYLNIGEQAIVSSSPERLLSYTSGQLETRPIKGTVSRSLTAEEDAHHRNVLLHSEKDRAELLMITDLMRNDLGKVSATGTVEVPEIVRCEGYTNVYHLLSVIRSQAKPDLSSIQLLRALFPGGSITGCPKLAAMQIIDRLEQRPRGIYTGSIGYFCGDGDFDFNIAIRTMTFNQETIDVRLGGAIVADSDPDQEYQECLDKGKTIFDILNPLTPDDNTTCKSPTNKST